MNYALNNLIDIFTSGRDGRDAMLTGKVMGFTELGIP
jgi:hypothetical protein